ncbi:MAG: SUMF1/EgtB/PvdO family nonheme iron enzyme [Thermoguttaceae bacterium]|nr:SUMF1/EgtB/PvdO family nonheme iron enzyme [Thermoguttaceae bacterium]
MLLTAAALAGITPALMGGTAAAILGSAGINALSAWRNRKNQNEQNALNREHQEKITRLQHELQQARDAENFERQRELQLELKKLEDERQRALAEFAAQNQKELARLQDALQQARDAENFERQRELQLELKSLESQNQFALGERNFQYQQELARERQNFERELSWARFNQELALWETKKLDETWPLRLTPRAYQTLIGAPVDGRVPLQILVGADLAPQCVADVDDFNASVQSEFTGGDALFRNGSETLYYTNGWKEGKIFRDGTAPFQLLFSVLKIPTLALAVERAKNGDYALMGAFWDGTENVAAPTFAKFCHFNAYDLALEVARAEARQNLERGLPDVAFAPAQSKNMNAYRKEKAWFEEVKYEEATPENRAFLDETAKTMFRGEYCLEGLDGILREVGTKAISLAIATAVDGYRVAHLGEAPRIPAFLASKKDDPLYPSVASVAEGYRALLNPTSARLIGPDSLGAPRRLAATAKAFYDAGAPEEAEWFQRAAWDVLKRFYGEPYQTQAMEHAEAIETLRRLPKQLGDETKTLLLFEENSLEKQEAKRKAREEAERKAKEEAERKAREEAERKAKEEAERIKRRFNSATTAGTREVLTIKGLVYAFRYCPPGTFLMGSPEDETGCFYDEETQHRVKLTNGFWMLETPVTQAMWKSIMGGNPSWFSSTDGVSCDEVSGFDTSNFPVDSVSWNDGQDFIRKLHSSGLMPAGFRFRLPTEAEWEYACRAGATGPYSGSRLDSLGWYDSNSNGRTHEVGTKSPNAWGLYDMHGNVWEWCADCFGDYGSGSQTDPTGPSSGSHRVLRGGGWRSNAKLCRSAYRDADDPTARYISYGFRLVLGR